jgi:hypothetical protein
MLATGSAVFVRQATASGLRSRTYARYSWRVDPTEDTHAVRAQRRAFVRDHRTAVFGYPRREHGPSMSIVVSSMRDRGKTKAVRRNGKVTLCILDEQWPMS